MNDNSLNNHFLDNLLNPNSIALYGANENLMSNMGSQQLLNILDNGYKGRVYPIHLKLDEVMGLKAYRSIADVPEIPDLAIVILPKRVVPSVFEEIGDKGVKNVVLVTAGFREVDDESGEAELNRLAQKYGFRFLGPNCLGFQNTHTIYSEDLDKTCILNFTWVNYKTAPGNVSIASQSGTFASHVNFLMEERDLNMDKCLSIGNEANIDMCDCLEYFGQCRYTDVILLYIEEIKRGRLFFDLVKKISVKKPIIALYVGGSEGGATAVSSHTGSMAGNDAIFDGLFEQTGIIRVSTVEELMNTATVFSKFIPKDAIPTSKRIGIVTNAGGPGATMADRASRLGLEIPSFSENLQKKLKKFLPATAQGEQAANPLDYTFSIDPSTFFNRVPKIIARSGEVDAIVVYGAYGPGFFTYESIGNEFIQRPKSKKMIHMYMQMFEGAVDSSRRIVKKYKVPVVYVNMLGHLRDPVVDYLNKKGFPTFRYPHEAVDAMKNLIDYGSYLAQKKEIDSEED